MPKPSNASWPLALTQCAAPPYKGRTQPLHIMPSKRELIEPTEGDKRYVRRDEDGQFTESDDLNRSLARDNDQDAATTAKPGQGDRGDRHTGDESRK